MAGFNTSYACTGGDEVSFDRQTYIEVFSFALRVWHHARASGNRSLVKEAKTIMDKTEDVIGQMSVRPPESR